MTKAAAAVFDLPAEEKLQLVEDLWDDLASAPQDVPVHKWQLEEMNRRVAEMELNPAAWIPWEDVKKRVRSRYGR